MLLIAEARKRKLKLKSERFAMAYRLLQAHAFMRPWSGKIAHSRRILTKYHIVEIETTNPTRPMLVRASSGSTGFTKARSQSSFRLL